MDLDGAAVTTALIGQRDGDSIGDRLTIQAMENQPVPALHDPTVSAVSIFGATATLYVGSGDGAVSAVVWGDGPYYMLTGDDPITFLDLVPRDFVSSVEVGHGFGMTFGELPDGYDVIVGPQQLAVDGRTASVGVTTASSLIVHVEVGLNDPMLNPATTFNPYSRSISRVDVNGRSGWLMPDRPDGPIVMWKVDESTYATVKWYGEPAEALDVARSLEFVDLETWAEHYSVAEPAGQFPITSEQIESIVDYVESLPPQTSTPS